MPRRALDFIPVSRIAEAKTTDDLIQIMQDEELQKKRQKILASMSPRLREKCEWIRRWMENEVQTVLRSRYELGEQVLEIYQDETENGAKVYGRRAIERICTLLDWDDGLIRACLRFVQTYTREDLDRITSLVLPRGEPVSWSHIRCLFALEDHSQREQLLDRTVKEGLTCRELVQEVNRLCEHDPADGRGRPIKIPSSYDGIVQQQKQFTDTWERRYLKVWSSELPQSFPMKAAGLAPEEVTEDRLREAAELAHQLRMMARQAATAADKAEAVFRDLERRLAERKTDDIEAEPVEKAEPPSPKASERAPKKAAKVGRPRRATTPPDE